MKKTKNLVLVGLIALVAVGCGKGKFDGTYVGTNTISSNQTGNQQISQNVTVTLSEGTKNALNGNLTTTSSGSNTALGNGSVIGAPSATITGTIDGDNLTNLQANVTTTNYCSGTLTGTMTQDKSGKQLTGSFTGNAGSCGMMTMLLSLTKQD